MDKAVARRTWQWVAVSVVLAFSAALRFWNQPGQLALVWDDEGIFMYQAWRLVSGDLPYKDLFLADTPLSQYLLGIVFKVFGVGPLQARGSIAAVGTVSVLLVFLIGKEVRGYWVGVLAAALFSFDPLIFNGARSFRPDYVVLAFELLALWLFVKALKGQGNRWSWLCGAALALAILSKLLAAFLIPPMVISAVAVRGLRQGTRDLWRMALAGAGVLAPFLLLFLVTAPREFFYDVYQYHTLKGRGISTGMTWSEKVGLVKTVFLTRPALLYPAGIAIVFAILRRERYALALALTLLFSLSFFFMKYFWEHYFTLPVALLALVCACLLDSLPSLVRSGWRAVAYCDKWVKERVAKAPWLPGRVSVGRGETVASVVLAVVFAGLVVGFALPSSIRKDLAVIGAKEPPYSDTNLGIALVKQYLKPGDYFLTDIPLFAVMTRTRIPDRLNDLSNVRMAAGLVKVADLVKSIEEHEIKVVMVMTGPHRHVTSMPQWWTLESYLRSHRFVALHNITEPTGFTRARIYVKQD